MIFKKKSVWIFTVLNKHYQMYYMADNVFETHISCYTLKVTIIFGICIFNKFYYVCSIHFQT